MVHGQSLTLIPVLLNKKTNIFYKGYINNGITFFTLIFLAVLSEISKTRLAGSRESEYDRDIRISKYKDFAKNKIKFYKL